jgi:S1-C subfamily serine protease
MLAPGVLALAVLVSGAVMGSAATASAQDGGLDAPTDGSTAAPVASVVVPPLAALATPPDMRSVHDQCVRSMVRIERPDGAFGSGFVAALQSIHGSEERRVVVTNRHVVEGVDPLRVVLYDGQIVLAHIRYVSDRIDLAILQTEEPIVSEALTVASGGLVRGERVVLGGNPGGLAFITTEGVVAGVISGTPLSDEACGPGHNCIVLDTEAEPGSSGGPVVNEQGNVIGMLWGVYAGTSFSVTIHGQTLATEIARASQLLVRRPRHARR